MLSWGSRIDIWGDLKKHENILKRDSSTIGATPPACSTLVTWRSVKETTQLPRDFSGRHCAPIQIFRKRCWNWRIYASQKNSLLTRRFSSVDTSMLVVSPP